MRRAGQTMGQKMAQTACAVNNARQRWIDGKQKCDKIYECEARKCVEGYEEWGNDARNRIGSCVDNYEDACLPNDINEAFIEPPGTYPPDNPDGSSNIPADRQDCANIQCDCYELMAFFGKDDLPRLAGGAVKCLESAIFSDPKHAELISWVMSAEYIFAAAADWAKNKLTDLHNGLMDFLGNICLLGNSICLDDPLGKVVNT